VGDIGALGEVIGLVMGSLGFEGCGHACGIDRL